MTANDQRVIVLLDNIRSLYNTGSILRTADASGVERVVLCGITPRPDQGRPTRLRTSRGVTPFARSSRKPVEPVDFESLCPEPSSMSR